MFNKNRRFNIGKFFFFICIAALFTVVLGTVVMLLWNAILPEAIGAKPLTFWKAIGLLILTRILFGGFRLGGPPRRWKGSKRKHWREKWMDMSEEEKAMFKEKWKQRCG